MEGKKQEPESQGSGIPSPWGDWEDVNTLREDASRILNFEMAAGSGRIQAKIYQALYARVAALADDPFHRALEGTGHGRGRRSDDPSGLFIGRPALGLCFWVSKRRGRRGFERRRIALKQCQKNEQGEPRQPDIRRTVLPFVSRPRNFLTSSDSKRIPLGLDPYYAESGFAEALHALYFSLCDAVNALTDVNLYDAFGWPLAPAIDSASLCQVTRPDIRIAHRAEREGLRADSFREDPRREGRG